MFRVYQNQFAFDAPTLEAAVIDVRNASAKRAQIVQSDGVFIIQRMFFEEGVLVGFEVRVNDRMVNMMVPS